MSHTYNSPAAPTFLSWLVGFCERMPNTVSEKIRIAGSKSGANEDGALGGNRAWLELVITWSSSAIYSALSTNGLEITSCLAAAGKEDGVELGVLEGLMGDCALNGKMPSSLPEDVVLFPPKREDACRRDVLGSWGWEDAESVATESSSSLSLSSRSVSSRLPVVPPGAVGWKGSTPGTWTIPWSLSTSSSTKGLAFRTSPKILTAAVSVIARWATNFLGS